MIYFNDIAMDAVAPVKIEDIRVSPISYSVTARQRPIQYGSDFVRGTGGSRTVEITFALLTEDKVIRQKQLQDLNAWAKTETEGKLMIDWYSNQYLNCFCTSLPEPSSRQWWESKLRIVFTTFNDPFWNSIAERTATCGTAFTVLGSAPPLMRIVKANASAVTNKTYSDGTHSMTFTNVPAGNLVIDLNKQTVAVDGVSIMQYYTFASEFPIPADGVMNITGDGAVYWRERWQ